MILVLGAAAWRKHVCGGGNATASMGAGPEIHLDSRPGLVEYRAGENPASAHLLSTLQQLPGPPELHVAGAARGGLFDESEP